MTFLCFFEVVVSAYLSVICLSFDSTLSGLVIKKDAVEMDLTCLPKL